MKKLFGNYIYFLFALLTWACSDDSTEETTNNLLTINPSVLRFEYSNTDTLNIQYTGHWEIIQNDAPWCTLDKTSGIGNAQVIATLTRQETEQLSGTIIVRSLDDPNLQEEVRCLVKSLQFSVTQDSLLFYRTSGIQEIDIQSNVPWTVELSDDSWLTLDKTSGTGNDKITLTMSDTENFGEKTADLVITPLGQENFKHIVKLSQSTDFYHTQCLTLNEATIEKPINVIIVGNKFTQADMGEKGIWKDLVDRIGKHLFEYEPYKSFKDCFNLYAVATVSETGIPFFGELGTSGSGNIDLQEREKPYQFAYENSPAKNNCNLEDIFVIFLENQDHAAGVAYMDDSNKFGQALGHGLCVIPKSGLGENEAAPFSFYFLHEFTHAFAKLADEYHGEGTIDSGNIERLQGEQENANHYLNLTFSENPNEFVNTHWAELYKMNYEGVGLIEGGYTFGKGVWRSTENSIMRGPIDGKFWFSAVQREIIVRCIYKYTGRENIYNLDVFLEYDKKNLVGQ